MRKIIAVFISLSFASLAFAQQGLLWDGFDKKELHWTPVNWQNARPIELSIADSPPKADASDGKYSLRIDIKEDVNKSKTKIAIYREEELDLSKHNISLDIFVQNSMNASAAVAFETGKKWTYYESSPVPLKKGWNKEVTFNLGKANFESQASGWKYNVRLADRNDIRKVVVLVYNTVLLEADVVYIDNIRFKPTHKLVEIFPYLGVAFADEGTKIISVAENAPEIPRYEKLELTVDLEAPYKNPFNPEEVDLTATFTSPSNETVAVPGFLYSAKPDAEGNYTAPVWKVRFAPTQEGWWQYSLFLKTPSGEDATQTRTFKCTASPDSPTSSEKGFVRVSKKDPAYFEFDDEEFYYALGQNVCWASIPSFKRYFKEMNKAGENWSRVWMSDWEVGLEWSKGRGYRGLGQYNLEKAEKLDKIVDLAKESGIFFSLVINHHGQLSTRVNPQWDDNPYNIKNGGPCKEPIDFFTDPAARKYFKNRMRYIIARWSYSPNIFAWELWNELTFIDDLDPDKDAAWHKEMARYIKEIDPLKHMISTSYAGTFHEYGLNKKVWEIPEIDFTQFHMYTHDVVGAEVGAYRLMKAFKKPYFMAEIGTDSADGVDEKDLDGAYLHSAIWSQFMLACGGNAMPWWWDKYIHPKKMYYHWKALSEYARGEDRRGKNYQTSIARIISDVEGLNTPIYAIGLLNSEEAFIWVFDLKWTSYDPKRTEASFINNAVVRLDWMDEGTYKVEFWDTYKGQMIETREIASDDNGLDFTLPPFKKDIACKIKLTEKKSASKKEACLVSTVPTPIGHAEKEISVKRAKGPITIDGDLGDWSLGKFEKDEVAYVARGYGFVLAGNIKEASDCSGRFYLLYDDANLYFAAVVRDNVVIGKQKSVDIWRDDNVELWIDTKGDADFFNNMPFNPNCYQIDFAPLTKDLKPAVYVYRNINTKPVTEATRVASVISEDPKNSGYTVEASIPISALNGLEMRSGGLLGVNFSVSDKDTDTGEWKHIIWSGQKEDDATQWGKLRIKN